MREFTCTEDLCTLLRTTFKTRWLLMTGKWYEWFRMVYRGRANLSGAACTFRENQYPHSQRLGAPSQSHIHLMLVSSSLQTQPTDRYVSMAFTMVGWSLVPTPLWMALR